MENTQAESIVSMEIARVETINLDITKPLQSLFDECLNFISVNDFYI